MLWIKRCTPNQKVVKVKDSQLCSHRLELITSEYSFYNFTRSEQWCHLHRLETFTGPSGIFIIWYVFSVYFCEFTNDTHTPILYTKPLHLCKQLLLGERLLVARLERWNSFIFCRRKPKSLRTRSLCYGKLKLVFTLTYLPLEFRRYHLATQLSVALNLMFCFKQISLVK